MHLTFYMFSLPLSFIYLFAFITIAATTRLGHTLFTPQINCYFHKLNLQRLDNATIGREEKNGTFYYVLVKF